MSTTGAIAYPTVVPGPVGRADSCQVPDPPVITGTARAICRNESVTLTATGCTGTVVWSNGETGDRITLQPQQTSRYTAICRTRAGCISCFADVWRVEVNTPMAPVVVASSSLICTGDSLTLTAKNCAGIVRWTDQAIGATRTVRPAQATTYQALCEQQHCISTPSAPVSVQISQPTTPIISADRSILCAGQSVRLMASNCAGTVRWTDGGTGIERTVTPYQSVHYRAVCQVGTCLSDSSQALAITVRSSGQMLQVANAITNGCPFQTADLTRAIQASAGNSLRYEFRSGAAFDAPSVQSPGAVLAGTYYIVGRDANGCYTNPAAVTVSITPCENGIPPCLSNPATVVARVDSIDWSKGVVRLTGRLGGSATQARWQSGSDGLFATNGITARYLLSEADFRRGTVAFALNTPDPDSTGPCVGASSTITVVAPAATREMIGLSKQVADPVWLADESGSFVELTYQLTVANLGNHPLQQVQVSDDLDAAFTAAGAQVRSAKLRADDGLVANASYTGRGADTTLLASGSSLPAGEQKRIWLTVRLDPAQASTLTFSNTAMVRAVDVNGRLCQDRSTNGTAVDPDQNGDPADNNEVTLVTLSAIRPQQDTTMFIPEGFSPNGDGINDRFVIQRIPPGLTIRLEVFNRWGHLVYRSDDYKNDWDGTPNQGIRTNEPRQGLPDGTYFYRVLRSDGREFTRFLTLMR
ncbi:gliding motility-associated C-terminal domain-containing protein [Fibrisoma limi]|nr:gliding motility-associated C-terminal domain-containing protein [Fibrisoma limi]